MNKCEWCQEGRYTLIGNKEMSTLYCMNLDKDNKGYLIEIKRILATSGKYITYAERCYVLDYITNLQKYYNDNVNKYEELLEKYSNLQEENERLNKELKLKTDFVEELLTIISVARDYELHDKCYTRSKIYQDKLKELKEGKE